MSDIVERLRFDAARCEHGFSKGVATNIEEAAAEIEQLRAQLVQATAQVERAAGIVLEPVSIPRQVFWCNGQKCQSGDGDTEFVTVREVEAAFRAKAEKIRASIASTVSPGADQ
jgi:hypothetical protein